MKLAIGTTVLGVAALAGIILAPSVTAETLTPQESRIAQNEQLMSRSDGTYVVYAGVGYGENCTVEVWDVPDEFNSISEYKSADANAAPWRVDTGVDPQACRNNSNPDAGDLPFAPPDYGYQWGIRAIDYMKDA